MTSQNDQPHTIANVGLVQSWNQQLSIKIVLIAFVQKNAGYIKGRITKYLAPKLFYGEIETLQTKSWDFQGLGGDSIFLNEFFLSRFFSYIGF